MKPLPKTMKRMAQAARLAATGKPLAEIADTLGVKVANIADWECRYPEWWRAALDEAREGYVEIVRNLAGTDGILKDPSGFLSMAEQANKWCNDHETELFPANGQVTLSTFYRDFFLPIYISPDASEAYRKFYAVVVRRWALVTGDPPLEKIDNAMLARFRDYLILCKGSGGKPIAAVTVANYLGMIQRLLDKAGPADSRNRNAANLIPRVPYVKRPSVPPTVVKIVSNEQLNTVYAAAETAISPVIAGVKAADWWRALLAIVYNTGLRRRTLFLLRWEFLDPNKRWFSIPASALKSKRPQFVPLNQTCLSHLDRIRTDRERIFEWPYHRSHFVTVFHRLQYDAGLPRGSHFGLHQIRKTTATQLWRFAPQAARLALGHATDDVTIQNYVQTEQIVAAAIDALPQPSAFTE